MINRKWVTLPILWNGLITVFPMAKSLWVTLCIPWKAVSSHLFVWPTGSEWHCKFCERQSCHIFCMANRQWVALHILWKAVTSCLFLWSKLVSGIAHFVKGSLITMLPMTNSMWVQLYIYEWQSHHMFSYDQQQVSDVSHFVKGNLITFDQKLVSDIAHFLACILSIPAWTFDISLHPIILESEYIVVFFLCLLFYTIIITDCKISFQQWPTCTSRNLSFNLYHCPWFSGEWYWSMKLWLSYQFAC